MLLPTLYAHRAPLHTRTQRRKVKCDKDKPHCGQCKKHSIPESDCTWSLDADHGTSAAAIAAAQAAQAAPEYAADWYAPASHATGTWSANGFVPASAAKTDDVPRLLERIAKLEQAITQTTGAAADEHPLLAYERGAGASTSSASAGGGGGGAAAEGELAPASGDESLRLLKTLGRLAEHAGGAPEGVTGEVERGMAADALAMIARHHPAAAARGETEDYYDHAFADGPRFPFRARPSQHLLREALATLPQDATIDVLIEGARTAHLHGTGSGVSYRLVQMQLACFRAEMARWDGGKSGVEMPSLDLSFVALLFSILSLGVELAEPSDLIYHHAVSREDEIGPRECACVGSLRIVLLTRSFAPSHRRVSLYRAEHPGHVRLSQPAQPQRHHVSERHALLPHGARLRRRTGGYRQPREWSRECWLSASPC